MSKFVGVSQAYGLCGAAVVIDVMRAFTVAAIALDRSAKENILVKDLDHALKLKAAIPNSLAFKDGEPQDGFGLCNSPAQLLSLDVAGKVIIQRTNAGTQGAVAARHCSPLLCASFVCASATAKRIRSLGLTEIGYVVTGDDGMAEEDRACAEFIDAKISNAPVDPAAYLRRARASKNATLLQQAAQAGHPCIDPHDVEMCLAVDSIPFALQADLEIEMLRLRPCEA